MRSRPANTEVLHAIEETGVSIAPLSAKLQGRLALIYHPYILEAPLARPLNVIADKVGLVSHHPLIDRSGETQYQLDHLLAQARDQIGKMPFILPVSDVVRRSYRRRSDILLSSINWNNMLDMDRWKTTETCDVKTVIRIGRHTRPDLLKWPSPETARLVYPEDPEFEFRMLGVEARIREAFNPWPTNWIAEPFSSGAAQGFLDQLDVYAYFHSGTWSEAFGYNILEAMSCGLPVVLPPHFRATFGDAALYADPSQAVELYRRLGQDKGLRRAQGDLARQFAEANHGYGSYQKRIETLIETRKKVDQPQPALRGPRPDRVMAVTSNGVGVGHLSRQLAIAAAQAHGVQTIFFSLSKGARFAAEAGYLTEYRAFHRQIDADSNRWNDWLYQELAEALAFYRPDCLVFDGNIPYRGMLDAIDEIGGMSSIWVRRGLWRKPDPAAAERAVKFDAIIEPAEVAAAGGAGHESTGNVVVQNVPVILSLQPEACLSRGVARRLLGLPQDAEVVLVQLGAGSNFDMSLARDMTLARLLANKSRHVVELISPAGLSPGPVRNERHHQISEFPAFRFHRAFDFAVSACGYNSFHEVIAGGIPCLFVPNSAAEMDLQEQRAAYAAFSGWSLMARADDPYGLATGLERIADSPDTRATLSEGLKRANPDVSGASAAARIIARTGRTIQRVTL